MKILLDVFIVSAHYAASVGMEMSILQFMTSETVCVCVHVVIQAIALLKHHLDIKLPLFAHNFYSKV